MMLGSHRELVTVAEMVLGSVNRLVVEPVIQRLGRPTPPRARVCAVCGDRVPAQAVFLRSGGVLYHAEPCLEQELPSLQARERGIGAGGHAENAHARRTR